MTKQDEVAKHYGPRGEGCRKPCPGRSLAEILHFLPCSLCGDTGFIIDTEHPIFKALWEECPTGFLGCSTPEHPHYVRRPRAEAALELPQYVLLKTDYVLRFDVYHGSVIICYIDDGWMNPVAEGRGDTWIEALSAALLAQAKAKGKT